MQKAQWHLHGLRIQEVRQVLHSGPPGWGTWCFEARSTLLAFDDLEPSRIHSLISAWVSVATNCTVGRNIVQQFSLYKWDISPLLPLLQQSPAQEGVCPRLKGEYQNSLMPNTSIFFSEWKTLPLAVRFPLRKIGLLSWHFSRKEKRTNFSVFP